MEDRARMAVIGVGLFGENHARAYSNYHRSRLVCVCDAREDRAKAIAERYGCDYVTDFKEIARSSEIDAISVATPDFAHLEPCLAVLESGKHLLVEKPLATKSDEARRIVEAARSRGLKLMTDFHNRWNPPFVEAHREIEEGRIGKTVMGYLRLSNPLSVPRTMLSWSAKSGPQWFLYPHIIDLARWLLGREATEVHAVAHKGILQSEGIDAYDAIQATVRFGEAFVTFETAWILPDSQPAVIDFKFNWVGEKGRISAVLDEQGLEIAGDGFNYLGFDASRVSHGKWRGFIYEPMESFVDCVLDDKEPEATGEDGLAATLIIEAILKSIETGAVVRVESV